MEKKVRIPFGGGSERTGWYALDGIKLFRVTIPKIHKNDVTTGTANSIRNQLKLTGPQFGDLLRCPMSGSDYEQLIREKLANGSI